MQTFSSKVPTKFETLTLSENTLFTFFLAVVLIILCTTSDPHLHVTSVGHVACLCNSSVTIFNNYWLQLIKN